MRISDWSSDVCSSDLGRRVGAGGAADGRLVDVDHLVAIFEAGHLVVRAGDDAGAVEGAGGRRIEGVDGEAGLARTRHAGDAGEGRSEEHTSELQSLMRISYAVFCLKKKK